MRCLDVAEEIAFFGLECRAIDQSWIETHCIGLYQSMSGDHVPDDLYSFYASRRATVRAMLCARHEPFDGTRRDWVDRARRYLEFAKYYLDDGSIH